MRGKGNSTELQPCLNFARPVILGGVGDIILSLLSLLIRSEAEGRPIQKAFASSSQEPKVNELLLLIASLAPELTNVIRTTQVIGIGDETIRNITVYLKQHAPSASVWGPRFFLSDEIDGPLFTVWPGASSNLGKVLETSNSWSSSYMRYAISKDIAEEMFKAQEITIREADSEIAFMSLTANSFAIDQAEVVHALKQAFQKLSLTLDIVTYNGIVNAAERPDITENPGAHGSIDKPCVMELSSWARTWRPATDLPFSGMIGQIKECDLLISFRSGLTDLAALLGKRLLTVYPSMTEFKWFRVSSNEQIISVDSKYIVTYCLPSLSFNTAHLRNNS